MAAEYGCRTAAGASGDAAATADAAAAGRAAGEPIRLPIAVLGVIGGPGLAPDGLTTYDVAVVESLPSRVACRRVARF